MTAPDHVVEPLKTLLREWGHPYMAFVDIGAFAAARDVVGHAASDYARAPWSPQSFTL